MEKVLKSWTARYTFLGVMVGMVLPILSTLAALAQLELPLTVETIARFYTNEAGGIGLWMLNLAPPIMGGIIGYLIGRQRERRERDVRRLRLIADIRSVLGASTGLDIVLNKLAPKWADLIGARVCSFAAWDEARGAPVPLHPRSLFDETIASSAVSPGAMPLTKWVVEHNSAKILAPPEAPSAVLAVPLAVSNRAFGVALFADSFQARRFDQSDAAVALAVSAQVALAVDRIRSSAETRRRARDMEAVSHVARRIAAGWDIDRILTTVAEGTQVRFGVDCLSILTIDESAGEFVERAQAGPLSRPAAPAYRQKLTDGLLGRAYASGRQVLARDVREEADYISATSPDVRSELIVPLRSGARVIGMLVVESRHVDAFGSEDIEALQMLADQAAVAVENARLYADALRERRRLGAVLASTGDAVIVTDAADRIQLFNRAAEEMFGVPAGQATGAHLEEALRLPDLLDAYRAAPPDSHVFELALDGATTLLGNLTPVHDDALGLLGRVLTLHDISDLKRLDALKSQMIRMASHDLRNPLNMAFGYVDLLEESITDKKEPVEQYLAGMRLGLQRMRTLIQDLLNVERIESAAEQTREVVDLNGVARSAVDALRPDADDKRHALSVELPEALALVMADPVQIHQVLVNLVSNAIKYTPHGGRIRVRVRQADDSVIVEVEDNGLGIPESAQVKLFQRFYRVKMKGTEDIEGTGLGLSLVKAVVEQHHGTMEVDSQEGQGSLFRVRLPALADMA
jgi:PAS domain S-box-containing protein